MIPQRKRVQKCLFRSKVSLQLREQVATTAVFSLRAPKQQLSVWGPDQQRPISEKVLATRSEPDKNDQELIQNFLQFRWKEEIYEFTCLPFGISVAPLVFTKMMKVPISCLRKMGVRLVVYLDDILIMNQSKQGVLTDCKCAINVLESLGFDVNYEKSVLVPSSVMEYLGFTVNTIDMTLSLPKQKIQKIKELSRQVIQSNHVSIRFLSELIGNLTASIQAIFLASLHYRHLQSEKNMVLRQGGGYNTIVTLSDQAIKEVNWWVNQVEVWNRKSLINPNPAVIIQSDASKKGWGAVCEKMCIGGIWLSGESQNHINVLELLAVTYAVKAFLKEKSDLQVLVQTDNKTAMTSLSQKDENGKDDDSINRPCLDNTTMVRNSPRDVCTGPSSPPGPPANFDSPGRSDSPSSSERIPTTSRLGCFRNNLKSYSLSEDTEKLLFSSWSKGTNSSYDSAWNKWTLWCLERQTDPFSVYQKPRGTATLKKSPITDFLTNASVFWSVYVSIWKPQKVSGMGTMLRPVSSAGSYGNAVLSCDDVDAAGFPP
uniref:Reverse transcriptase domain-containing protein n=1 Tax=Magallana gigas TaxID=29159 RepID=A0A8W8ISQ8_MAGGI